MTENIILVGCNHCKNQFQTFFFKRILKGYSICSYCGMPVNKQKNLLRILK